MGTRCAAAVGAAVALCFLSMGTAEAAADADSASSAPAEDPDFSAWASDQTPKPWMHPRDLVDASKWDLGGFVLVPEIQVPVFLTDPFGTQNLGVASETALGYGFQWRLGWSFGRVSIEPIVGFSNITRSDIHLPSGADQSMSLNRIWLGGQLRYTWSLDRVSPFVGIGGSYDRWTSSLLVRSGTQGADVQGVWAPSAHAMLGVYVRLFSIGQTATAFVEVGGEATYMFAGTVFASDQIAIAPYIGIDVMGALTNVSVPGSRTSASL
jgi:hypothetical protein